MPASNTRRRILGRGTSPLLTIALFVFLLVPSASGSQVGALNTFTNGSVADADEVNANFDAVRTAVNDNDTRITALENAGGAPFDVDSYASGTRRGFINFDGPARTYAERFHEKSGYPVVESDALHSTPGSLGSWVGLDLGVPILTLEYRRGLDPDTAWIETRDAILAVLEEVALAADAADANL